MEQLDKKADELPTMVPVSSSNLESVGYNAETLTLYVRFIGGGIYSYANVPDDVFNDLLNAASKGKFFATYIKNIFTFTKL